MTIGRRAATVPDHFGPCPQSADQTENPELFKESGRGKGTGTDRDCRRSPPFRRSHSGRFPFALELFTDPYTKHYCIT